LQVLILFFNVKTFWQENENNCTVIILINFFFLFQITTLLLLSLQVKLSRTILEIWKKSGAFIPLEKVDFRLFHVCRVADFMKSVLW